MGKRTSDIENQKGVSYCLIFILKRNERFFPSTKTQKALSAEQRGELIQLGYSTSSEEVLFYISDEMISYNGSKLYVVLPYKEGIVAVEEMETELGNLIYKTGCISHESLFVQWYVKNGDTESHAQFLKNKGFLSDIEEVRYILSFSSSNIGNSKMSARLFCNI